MNKTDFYPPYLFQKPKRGSYQKAWRRHRRRHAQGKSRLAWSRAVYLNIELGELVQ